MLWCWVDRSYKQHQCIVPVELFISREAATAERRYEKERQGVVYMHMAAFGARTNLFSLPSLPSPSPAHPPPPINLRRASQPASISAPPHTPWGLWPVSGDLGQNRGRPPFRSLWIWQLNLDSNCDHVRIFGAVIGHRTIGNGENLGERRDSDIRKGFDKSCRYNRPVQKGREAAHKSRLAWAFRSLEVYMNERRHHLNESSSARLGGSQQLEILLSPNCKHAQNLSANPLGRKKFSTWTDPGLRTDSGETYA